LNRSLVEESSSEVIEFKLLTESKGQPTRKESGGDTPCSPAQVTNYFHVEMDEEVIVNRVTTVEVIVSREVIDVSGRTTGATAQTGQAEIDPQKELIIHVIPKVNFETIGEVRIIIDPPEPGTPKQLYFDLRPTHLGDGEVWMIARQGQIPLVTLVLKPRIVQAKNPTARKISAEADTPEAPRLEAPLHQLRILELRNGGEFSYLYDLQSPSLNILDTYQTTTVTGDRHAYVTSIYKEIENRWLSNKDDIRAFTAELRAYGGQLFDQLFPERLQRVLWQHRDQIKSIMVISTEPFIPWELVHLKEPGRRELPPEPRFLAQMGVVRWLHGAHWPLEQLRIRKGKVRYVIPHYPDPKYRLPQAEEESRFLEDKFAATAEEPQPNAVRELLMTPGRFDLLHFACHGYAEQDNIANAQLILEGRIEGGKYLPANFSATTAEQYSNLYAEENRPMVVLNACQAGREGYSLTGIGGFAQAFLRGGAGAFIGTLWSVGDSPARTFTETLYSELLNGSHLADAVIKARERAQLAGDATWLSYAVYGHPHMKITG
jgi:hypothetical protein